MTDNTDALDELVSRYLDAEATADEVARVESDPDLLARADSMRAAIEAVATPVEIPTLDLDRIRAAAVAESTTSPAVTDLAARRRSLERRNRVMAVAAAFVVLAVSVVAVQNLGGDGEDTATVATDAGDDGASTDDASSDSGDSAFGLQGADESRSAEAEMSDDDMADEETADDDMAEDDMADDDMADEDAPLDDADDSADADAAAVESDPNASVGIDERRASVDLLPGQLGEFADDDALLAIVRAVYGNLEPPEPAPEVTAGLCDEAIAAIQTSQGQGTRSVESAFAFIAGEAVVVLVATDADGDIDVFVHPENACDAVRALAPELP